MPDLNDRLGEVRIEHAHRVGGHIGDRHLWMATINGEVEDYNSKDALIRQAEKASLSWYVVRHHRAGGETVVAESARNTASCQLIKILPRLGRASPPCSQGKWG